MSVMRRAAGFPLQFARTVFHKGSCPGGCAKVRTVSSVRERQFGEIKPEQSVCYTVEGGGATHGIGKNQRSAVQREPAEIIIHVP